MKKSTTRTERNWALVIFSSLLILIGLVLTVLAIVYSSELGWWALLVGLTGLSTIGASVMSIVKNDPSWVLLNLILP